MSNPITFAIDKNLEFVMTDPVWQKFFAKHNIQVSLYTSMKKLTEDMEKNTIALSYLPTANLFYFKSDSFYMPIANALFAWNKTSKISSLLVVKKDSPINTLADLKGKSLGYIHPYCTSSYFAPTILLWKNGYSIHNFFSKMEQVGAWQLQIDAVTSGKVDATTVQEDVWYNLPENAKTTKIIAKEDNLPSPLIICAKDIDQALLADLKEVLFNYKPIALKDALFNGFIPYQKEQVETFFAAATKAFSPQKTS